MEEGLGGSSEVGSGDWLVVLGAGGVKLAGVEEILVFVEEVEVGRAGSAVVFGNFLGFVVEVGEAPLILLAELDHFFGRVGGVVFDVVGADADGGDTEVADFLGEMGDGFGQVDDVGAVVTGENDEGAFFANEGGEVVGSAVGVGEDEVGSGVSVGELKGGFYFRHDGER